MDAWGRLRDRVGKLKGSVEDFGGEYVVLAQERGRRTSAEEVDGWRNAGGTHVSVATMGVGLGTADAQHRLPVFGRRGAPFALRNAWPAFSISLKKAKRGCQPLASGQVPEEALAAGHGYRPLQVWLCEHVRSRLSSEQSVDCGVSERALLD